MGSPEPVRMAPAHHWVGLGSSAQQQGMSLLHLPSGMQLENSSMEIKDTVTFKGAKVLKIKNIGAPSHMVKSQLVPSNFSQFFRLPNGKMCFLSTISYKMPFH